EYDPQEFIGQIKQMVSEITFSVMRDSSNRRIVAEQGETPSEDEPKKRKKGSSKRSPASGKGSKAKQETDQ
ncbi:MAG: hypothetical protein K2L68_04920, partial [Muribaculaceae bacterium]|nr:hypothetical protein [Muribaculaceae bacterium]